MIIFDHDKLPSLLNLIIIPYPLEVGDLKCPIAIVPPSAVLICLWSIKESELGDSVEYLIWTEESAHTFWALVKMEKDTNMKINMRFIVKEATGYEIKPVALIMD